jgi:LuxR family maltose regulon positive regulatory protein
VARGAAARAQLALTQGDRAAAVAWANASGTQRAPGAGDAILFVREAEYLTLARVWVAQAGARLPQALELLDRLLGDAEAKARMGSVVEILLVRALAQWTQGARGGALATLERALTLAAPEGFIRRFVDEGAVMATLLLAAQAGGVAPDYLPRLLAAVAKGADARMQVNQAAAPLHPSSSRPQGLEEPLSARELEVLRLIASGKSNADVARALVIATSTVKTHTNSIFAKLRVTSRTQAIALAHELRLL